jgi:hypothetical protein
VGVGWGERKAIHAEACQPIIMQFCFLLELHEGDEFSWVVLCLTTRTVIDMMREYFRGLWPRRPLDLTSPRIWGREAYKERLQINSMRSLE